MMRFQCHRINLFSDLANCSGFPNFCSGFPKIGCIWNVFELYSTIHIRKFFCCGFRDQSDFSLLRKPLAIHQKTEFEHELKRSLIFNLFLRKAKHKDSFFRKYFPHAKCKIQCRLFSVLRLRCYVQPLNLASIHIRKISEVDSHVSFSAIKQISRS